MFTNTVIVSTVRTAVGDFGGSLKEKNTVELGSIVIKEAIKRAGIDGNDVDEVILGCVGQYGLNAFLARLAAVKAGCDEKSTGVTVNRLCASGLQAIVNAAQAVDRGDADVCVAGGAESMSNFPFSVTKARWGFRMGDGIFEDDLTTALCEPFSQPKTHIAITAENIAAKYHITREEADWYALEGQQKAKRAIADGEFEEEIVPVEVTRGRERYTFQQDEHPRDTSMEKLGRLKPIVKPDGIVTAGNASGINDAAAAVVMMSKEKAKALGCRPLVRIVDYAVAGVDPGYMGMGPVASTQKLMKKLEKQGIVLDDIGLIELNEAFASQAIACIRELEMPEEIVNINGSGIALGHPIGATGAVISVKLIHQMIKRGIRYGLATLCIGGGQGMSVLYENMK